METADAKNAALKAAGAVVPNSYDDYDQKIKETYECLVKKGVIKPKPEPPAPKIPMDYAKALKEGLISGNLQTLSAQFQTTEAKNCYTARCRFLKFSKRT